MNKKGARASAPAQDDSALRILVISHSVSTSGGAEKSLLELLKQLKAKGNLEITVLFPKPEGDLIEAIAQIGFVCQTERYYRHCYPSYRFEFMGNMKVLIKRALDIRKAAMLGRKYQGKFDVVYSNTRVIFLGSYLAKALGIPHVWHIREFAEEFGMRFSEGHARRMGSMADRFITNSQAVANALPASVDRRKVRVIHNGIPMGRDVEKKKHDGINLLICGSIQPNKRQMDAVKALHTLGKGGRNDIRLHVAGAVIEGCEAYMQEMQAFVNQNGLQEHVIFLGYRDDMSSVRAQMDMEIICSEGEGFGRVCVEAMRAGLPVVAANCGALPEIIRDGVDGLLYRPRDVSDLCEKVIALLDERKRELMAANARENSKERFSPERNADQVFQVLQEVLRKREKA